jgi:hypothetical protein
MISLRAMGLQRLAANRRLLAERLSSLLTDSLSDVDHEDGGCFIDGLNDDVHALLRQMQRLDQRISNESQPGLREDLRRVRATIRALVLAIQALPEGDLEAAKLLAGGICIQLKRLQRTRRQLDAQLR